MNSRIITMQARKCGKSLAVSNWVYRRQLETLAQVLGARVAIWCGFGLFVVVVGLILAHFVSFGWGVATILAGDMFVFYSVYASFKWKAIRRALYLLDS